MDSQRNIIIITFVLISIFIWFNWQKINNYVNNSKHIKYQNTTKDNFKQINLYKNKKIIVKTNRFLLFIDPNGGNIDKVQLINYSENLHSKKLFTLLSKNLDFTYQVNSGIFQNNKNNFENNFIHPIFFTDKKFFQLKKYKNILKVPLFFLKNNILYVKTFIFKRKNYSINIEQQFFNKSNKPIEIGIFGEIKQTVNIPQKYLNKKNNMSKAFRGIAYSTEKYKYKKHTFNDVLENKNIRISSNQGWIAMLQQYFVTAWILPKNKNNIIYTKKIDNNTVGIKFKSSTNIIFPKHKKILLSTLWIGPEIQEQMAEIAPFLDFTVDYGMLWFLSKPLFKLLNLLNKLLGNWGIAIIAITLIVRIIMYPLSRTQYITIAKMRILQPKIKIIKEKYSNNKHQLSQEIIKLYKKEKLNPLGGCLPFIIQMPIFLALYYMLINSVELRHAPFIFWIKDLSSQDPYYVLPIIMSITMYFIQKTSKNTYDDPMQKNIMNIMPIFFSLFFLWFPSGLVLYYIISNILTIIQQKIIYSKYK
ncbi:membrane protein insertase YidC [Enterobacteriaceae endosymbiont of Plateumaris consimilis]|uniref:membrane protein insertase YidC n=1 Tax=Enterobacteriaceae endosymbiont of Plateumaris consimilis TaxID=2675794 RepID=UPI001448D08B|nr:membrane protein insertase YidC [Enterobacteriaceae endosymbiont of Plateumaris consimilis]QJC28830.1 membrane protein insertase YidC [Enterobacteriaceae endosymbiont of Plateumaris consimilis]